LWLRDITDDIKGPHLDFWGRPISFHTADWGYMYARLGTPDLD